MDYWWFIIFIAAFIVVMAGYFLWKQFFMRPQSASDVGASGTTPDYNDRHHRVDGHERTRGTEEPGTPLS